MKRTISIKPFGFKKLTRRNMNITKLFPLDKSTSDGGQ